MPDVIDCLRGPESGKERLFGYGRMTFGFDLFGNNFPRDKHCLIAADFWGRTVAEWQTG
jgi:hypothetical protein